MCRWFSIFVLQYFVYLVSSQEERDSSLLIRPIHPRRHKRAEQGRPTVFAPHPFLTKESDPQCMVNGRALMSCPKKNATDQSEKLRCIEARELCDDIRDCPGGEDEDPHFCMFKKLQDAELARYQNELRALTLANARKQQFKDVVVADAGKEPEMPPTPPQATRAPYIPVPGRPGVFQIPKGADPLSQMGYGGDGSNESDENEDDEEEEEEVIIVKKSEPSRKLRRSYRHILQLRVARL